MLVTEILLFFIGFILLIKGADLLVEGAASIAKSFNISQIVIGLTIVSFGTSAPELVVNILASVSGSSDITIGNVVGSNIANILLILGVAGVIYPIHTKKNTVWKEIPFALLSSLVLLIISNDLYFNSGKNLISRGDGILLLLFLAIFMTYVFAISKDNKEVTDEIKILSLKKAIIFIVLGISGLVLGGKFIVDSAISIARMLSVSESVIGFTLVAIGTSLPELATSAVAAYKKNSDIAIGNVVGSNIFNIFFIMGVSAIINPIEFNSNLNIDLIFLVVISFILFFVMFVGKKRIIGRFEGVFFILLYAIYMVRFFVFST